jgi:signal transduction histidine kinase
MNQSWVVTDDMEAARLEGLGRLAGGIAHDFNNLLAVISNYAAFVSGAIEISLRSGEVTALGEAMRDIEQIALAAERATVRTRQLLAFAQRAVSHERPLDLNRIVGDVMRDLHLDKRIAATASLAVKLPMIVADPIQIQDVLRCLIANAEEAMPHGGELMLTTRYAVRGEIPGVELRVRDTGTGMTDDVKTQAFEPFFTTKDLGAGAGLGLATVHGVIARAKGYVELDSTRGHGTTVTVWLPVGEDRTGPA